MKKTLLLLVVSALALSGCGGKNGSADQPAEIQISDPAKQLEAAAGNEFKIIINANPTTGYHWELMNELDESVVEFVSRDYRADTPQAVGSGGVDVWVFKAISPGEAVITLGYYPPDLAADAQQTVTFTVVVK
ncbi:MAG: protease inhibitor I42 family protein [Anaerolineales bacterium]|nr:protease inhibitor I42 family protein [Anaerolineales bacterium]